MKQAGLVDLYRRRLRAWIVVTQDLKEATITRALLVGSYNAIARLMPGANPA